MSNNDRYKPYYQQWDEKSFMAEIKVQHMCPEARAYFRTLLQRMFIQPEAIRPALPNDDNQLWKIADAKNLKHWQKHKEAVLEMFYEDAVEIYHKNENRTEIVPVLRQNRVEKDFSKLMEFRRLQKEKGSLGGRPKSVENKEEVESYG